VSVPMTTLDYSIPVTTLAGEATDLTAHRGRVLLIVNVASKCGFTPQYAGLQAIHERHVDDGLVILGFPCNQFANQEPGDSRAIQEFCQLNYGVTFPMFERIDVNGSDVHPLFQQLKSAAPGLLGSESIKWNFTKFLVARDGTIVKRYGSKKTPEALSGDIERELAVVI
jgi:glutathione peroxidase